MTQNYSKIILSQSKSFIIDKKNSPNGLIIPPNKSCNNTNMKKSKNKIVACNHSNNNGKKKDPIKLRKPIDMKLLMYKTCHIFLLLYEVYSRLPHLKFGPFFILKYLFKIYFLI